MKSNKLSKFSKFKKFLVPFAAAMGLLAVTALGQDAFSYLFTKAVPVNVGVGADDSNVAIIVRGNGISAGCFDVGTTTAREMAFYTDAIGVHTAVDTTVNADLVCGATAGQIELSDADCNTVGELVTAINKSANWRAVAVDAVAADTVDSGAASNLNTLTYTSGQVAAGTGVVWDTNVKLQTIRALLPSQLRTDARNYFNGTAFKANPYGGTQAILMQVYQQSAFTTQTYFEVYSVKPNYTSAGVYTDTATLLWREVTAATGTYKTFTFSPYGVWGDRDSKLLVRVTGASVYATELAHGFGYFFPYPRP